MKKILVLLISFFTLPIVSLAVDYDLEEYYIDASILENGDMEVTELIVMDGTFNGYEVGLEYNYGQSLYIASDLELKAVGAISNPKNISFDTMRDDFETFTKVTSATNGDKLKYIETDSTGSKNIRMYYSTNHSKTAFLIKYVLKDVAIVHNDCVEVYWNFFSNSFRDDIKKLYIRVNLPGKEEKENFHWWFHGPLTGNSDINTNHNAPYTIIDASVKKVDAYTPVDFRILLPKTMFNVSDIKKYDNKDVKKDIISSEDEIVAKDLETIKNAKKLYYTAVVLTSAYYIVLVGLFIYAYKRYDKERKPNFQNHYNREFIDDYNVEVIDYLMNRVITSNAMSASILNLIYKKNISYEKLNDEKKENYKFTLVSKDNLNETELMLVEFLFNRVGKDNEFSTIDLKKYASSTKTCNEFMSSYTRWKNKVIGDGVEQKFFDLGTGKFRLGILMFLFWIIIAMFVSINNIEFIPAYFCIVAWLIFVIYLATAHKKSEKGIEHYAKWKAFKNFLKDFGAFDIKELPEIELWERYLVYATIFGLAETVEKAMNVKIKELDVTGMNTNVYIGPHIHIAPVINSSINSAYREAQTTITRSLADSSGGSFGGHGGGFSSGGGFGGGGRSGGGF